MTYCLANEMVIERCSNFTLSGNDIEFKSPTVPLLSLVDPLYSHESLTTFVSINLCHMDIRTPYQLIEKYGSNKIKDLNDKSSSDPPHPSINKSRGK